MQPQVKTEFSVTVFPNGAGWGEENPARIYFPDQETKDAYVESEGKFCAAAYAEFNGADSKAKREELRVALLKKRAFFAQKNDYAPTMKDRKMWFYQPPRDKLTV